MKSAVKKAVVGLAVALAVFAGLFVPGLIGGGVETELTTQSLPVADEPAEPEVLPTEIPLPTATAVPPTPTVPPVPSATAEPLPTAIVVEAPTATPTAEPAPAPEPEPTVAPLAEPEPTAAETAAVAALAAAAPAVAEPPTPEPTATVEATPEPTATAEPTPEPTPEPTATPEPTPTIEPTATAEAAPEPTATATPTPEPTATAEPLNTGTSGLEVEPAVMYVTSNDGLFLRDAPGGQILTVLTHRAQVHVTGAVVSGGERLWIRVDLPQDGWAALSFLSLEQPVAPPEEPVTTGPSEPPSTADWTAMRNCESGGRYDVVDPSGLYHGAYQFLPSTWDGLARRFWPELVGVLPSQAAPADQDKMALKLYELEGARPWPTCGRHLL